MDNGFNSNVVFPETVKKIKMGWLFNKNIVLPPKLISLEMGWNFNKSIDIPKTLTYLKIGRNFMQEFKMPKNLVALDLLCCSPTRYRNPRFLKLFDLPNTLRKIIAGRAIIDYICILPISLLILQIVANTEIIKKTRGPYNIIITNIANCC